MKTREAFESKSNKETSWLMCIKLKRSHTPEGGTAGLSSPLCHAAAVFCLSVIQNLSEDIIVPEGDEAYSV